MNKTWIRTAILLLMIVAGQREAESAAPAPVTLESAAHYKNLQEAVNAKHFLFLPTGSYAVDAPLLIDGWDDGVIMGAGRISGTTLSLKRGIRIHNCRHIVLCNLHLVATGLRQDPAAIEITGDVPGKVQVMNVLTEGSPAAGLAVHSPSQVLVQECHFTACQTGVVVDHPRAQVTVLSGNCQGEKTHIQQLAGDLQAYAIGFQGNTGRADIELTHPASRPFVVAACRTEGPGFLVRTPDTTEKIDLVVKANSCPPSDGFIRYGAAGTLALLGNHSAGGTIDASGASGTIWSIGNSLGTNWDKHIPYRVGNRAQLYSFGDIWETFGKPGPRKDVLGDEFLTAEALQAAGQPAPPNVHYLPTIPISALLDTLPVDTPPVEPAPMPLIANLGQLIPTVKDYGAVGDGKADDTAPLQRALNTNRDKALYFPAGTYRVTAPLFLDHWGGGWLAGAGMDTTHIVNATGGALRTDGCGYAAFQDLSFTASRESDAPAFDLSWDQRHAPPPGFGGAALQANTFHRCRFEGGSAGLIIGREGYMGSETLVVDCEMLHSKIGMATANFNALSDNAIHCLFRDNDIGIGQGGPSRSGSFNVFGCRFEGSARADIYLENEAADSFYIQDCTSASNAPVLLTDNKGADIPVLFDRFRSLSTHQPVAARFLDGGALIFLNSQMGAGHIEAGATAPGREAGGVIPCLSIIGVDTHDVLQWSVYPVGRSMLFGLHSSAGKN